MTKTGKEKTRESRRAAREFMMKVVYQMDIAGSFDTQGMDKYLAQGFSEDSDEPNDRNFISAQQRPYCEKIYSLICDNREEIDAEIESHCRHWTLSRMPKTDLAVLRLAACEILYMDEIPDAVSINEAVDLAKKYGTDKSPSYVNGILGSLASSKRKE
ncbi:MAG: transcription antitermination factor NusB [Eubacterium sp.]|jgi:N utilization substance protein B